MPLASRRTNTALCALALALSAAGCGKTSDSSPQSAATASEPPAIAQPGAANSAPSAASGSASTPSGGLATFASALGRGRPVPAGLVAGGDCPPAPPDAAQEIAAQAQAAIPLVEGLTFTYDWKHSAREDYECLLQIKKIDNDGLLTTASCDVPGDNASTRKVCRADLRSARMLHTLYGAIKVIGPSGEPEPETITGATAFSLSSDEFARLKKTGDVTYHYVELADTGQLVKEATADLRAKGRETVDVLVNDRPLNIPVIKAEGTAKWWWVGGEQRELPMTVLVLDDERFPLLIDHGDETSGLGIRFRKITYPRSGRGLPSDGVMQMSGGRSAGPARSLEQGLLEDKRVDVYGIYFDFNSDRIRPESEPILQEIGSIMKLHPDWRLSIQGHTDNVGGNGAYNLELSRRRSAAVQSALVKRFAISADRLTSGGSGAASPKDTNDTKEGRARNRRVELVRQ